MYAGYLQLFATKSYHQEGNENKPENEHSKERVNN